MTVSPEMCELVMNALANSQMPTAVNVRRALPKVNSGTIYKALNILQKQGRIEKTDKSPALYRIIRRTAE